MNGPVLIGGAGRCGTTVLKRCLGRHPQVAWVGPELRWLSETDGLLDLWQALVRDWTPGGACNALDRYRLLVEVDRAGTATTLWGDGALEAHRQLVEAVVEGRPNGSIHRLQTLQESQLGLAPVFRRLMQRLWQGKCPGTSYWVDDTPMNACRFRQFREVWPRAVLVYVVRHPLETVASMTEVAQTSDGPSRWYTDPAANARRVAAVDDRLWQQDLRGLRVVKLEELVEDPVHALQEGVGMYRPGMEEPVDGGRRRHDRREVLGAGWVENNVLDPLKRVANRYDYRL